MIERIFYFIVESFLEGGWRNVWVVLHKDSYMLVFKKQGDSTPKAKIFMKVS